MADKRAQRKRKKAQRRKKRVTRSSHQQPAAADPMMKFQERLDGEKVEFVHNAPGELKMSQALEEFIAPYEHAADTDEALERLVAIAALAWNAALIDEPKRSEKVESAVESSSDDPQAQQDMRDILTELIERKERHFGDIQRYIMDFQITSTPTGFHLAVASTLSPGS